MKTLIDVAVTAAVAAAFALPAFAQTSTPSAQERAENREKVQDKLPSASERAQNREKVNEKLPTAEERAKNRDKVSTGTSNAALTSKVKSALARDVGAGTMTSIDVDSDKGVVTLKGKVDSADAKKKAEAIAKKVDGVKSVKNQLRVEAKKEKQS